MKILRNIFATIGFFSTIVLLMSLVSVNNDVNEYVSPVSNIDGVASDLAVINNKYRESKDLKITMEDETTCEMARIRLSDMESSFSHDNFFVVVDKVRKEKRIQDDFGENLYGGTVIDAQHIFNMWIDSPAHREIIEEDKWNNSCFRCNDSFCVAIFSNHKYFEGPIPSGASKDQILNFRLNGEEIN